MWRAYANAHPGNARAFAAAYRGAVDILMNQDDVWQEHGERLKLSPESLVFFKQQVRRDLLKQFTPDMTRGLEATLVAVNGVAAYVVAMTALPSGLLSLAYQ